MAEILTFTVNQHTVTVLVDSKTTLLEVLREKLGITSPKCGCNHGDCGACTIILNGKTVKSCMVLALTVEGMTVQTIEGISNGNKLHPVQQAFIDYSAPQCGFCTPGFIMAAKGLLDRNPTPSTEEIKEALEGNLCRCTGYKKYVEAVVAVARGDYGKYERV